MITKQTLRRYTREIGDLGIGEKLYGIVTVLILLTTLLLIMSVQAVRLQNAFRADLAAASTAAINIERVARSAFWSGPSSSWWLLSRMYPRAS